MKDQDHNIFTLADHLFRHESAKMVAVLTRIFGLHNLELVEDVMQDAFAMALKDWAFKVPSNPSGWLMQTAKNRAIDIIRRERYKKDFAAETSALLKSEYTAVPVIEKMFMEHEIQDSQLRMIFACCHPSLSEMDQIALTLKTCSAFSIQEIASALLTNNETIKKRLQRAKSSIREKNIHFDIPTGNELKNRLDIALHVIYLIFNEGYSSSSKEELIRRDLCEEAMRLSFLLTGNNYTNYPKCYSLVALMALLASRFDARLNENGEIILLEEQDRSKWNMELIDLGLQYLERSSYGDEVSRYHIEAAIVAEHSFAKKFADTNWELILSLYDRLILLNPSPAVLLNRAIVTGKLNGAAAAIEEILFIPDIHKLLDSHYLFATVLGELYRQMGDWQQSTGFLEKAIHLTTSIPEKNLLKKKLKTLQFS